MPKFNVMIAHADGWNKAHEKIGAFARAAIAKADGRQ